MKQDELQNHFFTTYINVRTGIAIVGVALPFLLWWGGLLVGIEWQNSISAYYHAGTAQYSMRNFFVGGLFIIGALLYLYKGYSLMENIFLNIAGAAAVGVALFPMEWVDGNGRTVYEAIYLFGKVSLHGFCAVVAFIFIALVCFFCANDTLHLLEDEQKKKRYQLWYRIIGILMIVLPLVASFLALVLQISNKTIFIIETVGMVVFVAYWLVKGIEIRSTNAEQQAAAGALQVENALSNTVLRWTGVQAAS
ncbi:MAG: hypothetical protein AAFP19_15755 [Bacteroidota bacterium]